MNTTRSIAAAALIFSTGLAVQTAHAQQVGARRIDLQRRDLSITGREVVQTIVELEPGTTAPRHAHPGEEIIYVLEGMWEYTLEGKPPVTLTAGDVLFIPAGTIHSARNVGAGRGRELATYIVEKGKPLLVLATPAARDADVASGPSPGVVSMPASTTPTQATNLFLVDDLEDPGRTRTLATSDLDALRAVADWVRTFVVRPHKDLGRDGPVCPFVPQALEREILWLAPEQIGDRSAQDVVRLVDGYKERFLRTRAPDGDDVNYESLVLVFPDLPPDRAESLFDEVLKQLAVPAYAEDGLVMGGFHPGNQGSAIYNPDFQPFRSPVPFLLMRHAVVSDWKFFLGNEEMLKLWAHRYGESAALVLAEELRRLPWRTRRD